MVSRCLLRDRDGPDHGCHGDRGADPQHPPQGEHLTTVRELNLILYPGQRGGGRADLSQKNSSVS